MDRKLLIWLIIPLSIIAIVLILLSFFCSDNFANIELNLGTELIAIIIVVAYVDWVIKKRDEERWIKSNEIILRKVSTFNNTFIATIRRFLGLKTDIFDPEEFNSGDEKRMLLEVLKVAEESLLPMIDEKKFDIDQFHWDKLFNEVNKLNGDVINLILIFGNKISPDIYTPLLSIQSKFESIMLKYATFPEFFVANPTIGIVKSEIYREFVAEDLEYCLKISIKLNNELIKNQKDFKRV